MTEPTVEARPLRSRLGAPAIWLLAFLAYVPALTASPGRLPTDTKLYLYLSPGRLISDAPFTWDTRQFAGWVPHQTIAYLWPSGPWFWTFEQLGVPDWIAHRLWIGTLLFLGRGTRLVGPPPVSSCAVLVGVGAEHPSRAGEVDHGRARTAPAALGGGVGCMRSRCKSSAPDSK